MATISNFNIEQGSTFTSTINISNTLGGLFQLDSYTARGKVRKSYRSGSYTALTCSITNNSPAQDIITISLSAAQTKALKPGRYIYDVEIFNTNAEVIRIIEGQIEVLASASQANPLGQGLEFSYTEENFQPHTMYSPSGTAVTVNTMAEHTTYHNQGYTHVYPIGGGFSRPAYYQGPLDTAATDSIAKALDTSSNPPASSGGQDSGDSGGGGAGGGSGGGSSGY